VVIAGNCQWNGPESEPDCLAWGLDSPAWDQDGPAWELDSQGRTTLGTASPTWELDGQTWELDSQPSEPEGPTCKPDSPA
jgi:hypothetical protein